MSSQKILVTPRSFRNMAGSHQQMLLDAGYEIVNSPYDRPLEAYELAALIPGMVGAILGVDEVSAAVFAQADQLRVISRYGVGVDRVDLHAATRKGVIVTNTPGGNTNSVAELTLGFMLALARNLTRHDRNLRNQNWSLLKGSELAGQTLGLLGMGRIGRRVAQLAHAFGMRILYCDPCPPPPDSIQQSGAVASTFEEILTSADFISLHVPLTTETHHLINADALAKMKPGAFLINTARGGLVDEVALYQALIDGKLGGAAVDTFQEEPSLDNPLLQLDHFIGSPHIGSSTHQTTLRMGIMASENLLAVLRGERPECVVNPEVFE